MIDDREKKTRDDAAPERGFAPAPTMRAAEPSPGGDAYHSDVFLTVVASFVEAQRPDWAERLGRLAEEITPKDEQKARRLAKRDDLIRKLADEYYATVAGFRPKARLIAADLASAAADALSPSSIAKNFMLREILDLNEDEARSVETIRKVLARVG
jgi:hypothetical protein